MVTALWILVVLLVLGWLLGVGGVFPIGGIVYVLLALAIAALVVSLVGGRRVRPRTRT